MSNVVSLVKGSKEAPRSKRSKMETLLVSLDDINKWQNPPSQRPLRVNSKVKEVAFEIRSEDGIVPGVITLGRVLPDKTLWVVDGQHRLEGARLSGKEEFIIDVRIVDLDSMSEIAEEFVRLNSRIANMRPDDILRAERFNNFCIARIIEQCPFVGFDSIRRGTTSPIVSMSALLRCWFGSESEVPGGSISTTDIVRRLDDDNTAQLIGFLKLALEAWGRDAEYHRLWLNINMTICMWIYRRTVLERDRTGTKRSVKLTADEFKKCLCSVSARHDYLDWLPGRLMNDRDRSPCYSRIKAAFQSRLKEERGELVKLPAPSWASK